MTSFPAMPDDAMIEATVEAAAPLLGIEIDPDWKQAVAANLKATSDAARLVLDFPLDDELEPAAVFRA
jgi:hypothetical protein